LLDVLMQGHPQLSGKGYRFRLVSASEDVLAKPSNFIFSRRYTCRLPVKFNTRGFYECTAVLYHHARGTPPKRLFWAALADRLAADESR
jgi:hypothetical protein